MPETTGFTLAEKMTLDMNQKNFVQIDGFNFPWYLAEGGIQIEQLPSRTSVGRVSLTVLVGSLEVVPFDASAGRDH